MAKSGTEADVVGPSMEAGGGRPPEETWGPWKASLAPVLQSECSQIALP